MIDLAKLIATPLVPLTPARQLELEHELMYDCINEGRAARTVGVAFHKPPPFRRDDMLRWWQIGWIYEHQDRATRRATST
jgi:hypothetical protein